MIDNLLEQTKGYKEEISLTCNSLNREPCDRYGLEFFCTKNCLYALGEEEKFVKTDLEI